MFDLEGNRLTKNHKEIEWNGFKFKTVRRVRVRGGNVKWRALRLDTGNFSWGSEAGAIIQVDDAPFKKWYLQHYGVEIGRKKKIGRMERFPDKIGGNLAAAAVAWNVNTTAIRWKG
ncbi:40S ribosomal protein s8 [Phtheirospermum japonicum]|uniref:40S ribosomal protein s8 n=1 Tax=Phtheirospermum japonicum TaxID=374723 RepID=A0A830CHR0_9LAMI|nr:40S ribosomal protein s8 [Phtheirospermum japonicum]